MQEVSVHQNKKRKGKRKNPKQLLKYQDEKPALISRYKAKP